MSKPVFPYSSIHDFLDKRLSEVGITNPTKQEIKRLKKKYTRLKNNYIKAVKRYEQREVTLYFTDKELQQLQKRQAENQSLPNLVHTLAMVSVNNENIYVIKHDPMLEQLLFQLIDKLDDLMEQNPIYQTEFQALQNSIQTLEKHFEH